MSDPRKILLGATATIVAARIAARAHQHTGGDLQKPPEAPALQDEFVATYKELEQALDVILASEPERPHADKPKRRENGYLLED